MPERYPLEAARKLRDMELDAAREALAARGRALDAARAALSDAETSVIRHREETREIETREGDRARDGSTVDAMARVHAYMRRRKEELAALERSVADARTGVTAAEAAVESARAGLAEARANREAVEKHHAKWVDDQRKERDAREEDDADDVVAARRPPR